MAKNEASHNAARNGVKCKRGQRAAMRLSQARSPSRGGGVGGVVHVHPSGIHSFIVSFISSSVAHLPSCRTKPKSGAQRRAAHLSTWGEHCLLRPRAPLHARRVRQDPLGQACTLRWRCQCPASPHGRNHARTMSLHTASLKERPAPLAVPPAPPPRRNDAVPCPHARTPPRDTPP